MNANAPVEGRKHRLIVDGGTTTTRVWAVEGTTILAEARTMVGARDTARDGSPLALESALRGLLHDVSAQLATRLPDWNPECIVAAGMITSPLGIADVPHVQAPAGIDELASATRRLLRPDITPLPLLLVPGVRCGPEHPDVSDIPAVDVMRGEEAVCLGLVRTGVLQAPGNALSVGSHWKRVGIAADGRIDSCVTTISGELLHVLRTQTVLAASIAPALPDHLDAADMEAFHAGMEACERSGLPRAAFCTRLLERAPSSTPRFRLAFLLGVVVSATLGPWREELFGETVALLGAASICEVWEEALAGIGCQGVVVGEKQAAQAFVAGLVAIAERIVA
jgi:2-dehydro-3-deoxygalactonokinase